MPQVLIIYSVLRVLLLFWPNDIFCLSSQLKYVVQTASQEEREIVKSNHHNKTQQFKKRKMLLGLLGRSIQGLLKKQKKPITSMSPEIFHIILCSHHLKTIGLKPLSSTFLCRLRKKDDLLVLERVKECQQVLSLGSSINS